MVPASSIGSATPSFSSVSGLLAERRRIRLVFVIDNMRLGGTELNAVRTAERMDRSRFDLRVVCLNGDGPLTARYRALGVPIYTLPLRSFYGTSMISGGWRFVTYLRRERIDIVHAHDVYSNIFASLWARLARVPVVIASRRWWNSFPNRKLRLGNRMAFSLVDAVLANSSQVAWTVRNEGVPSRKIWTVTNFADDEAFIIPSAAEYARIRRGWGVPEDAVVIGCVARFDPVKDHATLLRAFATLRRSHPDAFLVLIGDGPTRSQTESLATSLDLNGHVIFVGEIRDGKNHHHGFDISVLASISEGFPNSIVEAMAAEKPVVATAVGGTIDAVVTEVTGLLVRPGDPGELGDALSRLVSDRDLRRRLGHAGLAMARMRFNAPAVLKQVEDMYDTLLSVDKR